MLLVGRRCATGMQRQRWQVHVALVVWGKKTREAGSKRKRREARRPKKESMWRRAGAVGTSSRQRKESRQRGQALGMMSRSNRKMRQGGRRQKGALRRRGEVEIVVMRKASSRGSKLQSWTVACLSLRLTHCKRSSKVRPITPPRTWRKRCEGCCTQFL
ncbi:hypothetical protein DUNSADRAFT_8912 [Dunaliella salina]|uniref:Encoded protein n=1 Tax=Dunaliella salina TaxID=3046 RepID=A0ABQ7FSS5_DUNSA|nr:hypothetical protein DUNSADRAFT_8912 [Dunaliella salina]|eukprot:KAF5825540.1 hypothetical protein DUNSADRAFT_8912 [Dunaliella salina]